MTPSEIRARCDSEHFFSRATMRFFGDTMRSYGVRTIHGQLYMYRKPSARVNVFGRWQTAGQEFFGAWRIIANNDGTVSLLSTSGEEKDKVYYAVTE